MSEVKVTIHSAGEGVCSLSGKECEGITVTFEDGTVTTAFLSWRSFKQLLAMKSKQHARPKPQSNGTPVTTPVK